MTTDLLIASFTLVLLVPIVAGWTAMWLTWMFKGDVRHWIVAAMPQSWRAQSSRSDILILSEEELSLFVVAESDMPELLRGILTCRLCMSAWLSGAGSLLLIPIIPSLWLLPLVCGCGAYMANRINPGE